ncbi:aspartate/glutamate racemase family protein [Microtetraspora malaysiensis]|uniref:aspartate/glutamate racemase family protein n=1 Tax=Microtetraspora malaysiensis TaxID=161358 RepID=UPI003D93A336
MVATTNSTRSRLVGVLGGMGPAATADFYTKLVASCPALTDQEHVPLIIWADPTTPDRSAALLGEGPDPTPWLRRGCITLHEAGAELIVLPCNTAHAFVSAAIAGLDVRFLSMVEEAVTHLEHMVPRGARIGLLATTGTLQSRLYQEALGSRGLVAVVPSASAQTSVMAGIRAVKAGELHRGRTALTEAAAALATDGVDVIVGACTEIPLVLAGADLPVPLIDPAQVLADAVVHDHLRRTANVRR